MEKRKLGNSGLEVSALTPDDLREINAAAAQVTIQGARYPDSMERMTGL